MPFTSAGVVRENLFRNPDFTINQRGFAFGALADGAYGVDGWKAAGAANLGWSATDLTLTVNAGAIRQVVEPAQWGFATLASQQVTVSVEGLLGASLNVQVGTASGSITPGGGRRSVTLTLGAGDTGNLTVTLTPSAYPAWFRRAKLEAGSTASTWSARPLAGEIAICQRYFTKSMRLAITPGNGVGYATDSVFGIGGSLSSAAAYGPFVVFPARMRTVPTVALYRTNLAAGDGMWQYLSGAWVSATGMSVPAVSETGFLAQLAGTFTTGQAIAVAGGWAAAAEL